MTSPETALIILAWIGFMIAIPIMVLMVWVLFSGTFKDARKAGLGRFASSIAGLCASAMMSTGIFGLISPKI